MNWISRPRSTTTQIFIVGFLITVLLLLVAPRSGTANQGQSHKVIAQTSLIKENGGEIVLWHDYGSFALYRVTDDAWRQLPEDVRSQARILDDANQLFVGDKGIDTEQEPLRQREISEAIHGESLHLIQFVGPIKEEWLTAVEATGADPVQYIANYGYMVWTDTKSRQGLNVLSEHSDFLQLSMPYFSSLKLGPTIGADQATENDGDDLVAVTIQLYRHDGINESERVLEEILVEISSPWEFVLNFQNIKGVIRRQDIPLVAALPDVVWIGEQFPRELNDEVQGQIMANNLVASETEPAEPGYLSWLLNLGFSNEPESYPLVDITDDGIGNGVALDAGGDVTLREMGDASLPSRLEYIANCTSEPNGAGPDGHGHLNISIAGGYDERSGFPYRDGNGYQLGLGINPYGRFAGTRVFDSGFNTEKCGGTDSSLIRETYNRGARIASNSWGCRLCVGEYDTASQAYDAGVRDADPNSAGNQELTIFFSSGNYGPDQDSISTPGNAKNVITVGASENVRPTWTDGCNISPNQADSVMDIASFSSRGPAPSGRIKPDVVAPGSHVQGTASTTASYNGSGVCDKFHPAGQEIFAASSGTSHSTPAVAGMASLTYAFLQQNYDLTAPSPALLKAFIVAHTMYLNGLSSGGDLPNFNQGFGLPDMSAAFDDTPRVIADQTDTKLFDESGETWSLEVTAEDPSESIRIVMAYTDQPGAIGKNPQVNDLNLAVHVDGNTYLGNQMTGQWSVPGGTPDRVNTVEAVYLPSVNDPSISIKVTAFNIAGDGVPGVGDGTDQDFTIVCSNCSKPEDFTLVVQPVENSICSPGQAEYKLFVESINGFSQAVTLDAVNVPKGIISQFSKNPVTPTDTSQLLLSATEMATTGAYEIGITSKSENRRHSVEVNLDVYSGEPRAPRLLTPPNGADSLPLKVQLSWRAVPQATTYDVQVALDSDFNQIVEEATGLSETAYVTSKLQIDQTYYWRVRAANICAIGKQSETSTFNTIQFPGQCPYGVVPEIVYSTDFEDSAIGWLHQDSEDSWQLSNKRAHSATTSYYAVDANGISDQKLVSPAINLPVNRGPITLQFYNYQSLEDNIRADEICFDGAILEISNDDGQSWQQIGDLSDDHAVLITQPYDGIIASAHENPLGGKPAWCGDSQEWLNSVVRIDEFATQTVRFRFRLGSDYSIGYDWGYEGWYIDDVRVQSCPLFINSVFLPQVLNP